MGSIPSRIIYLFQYLPKEWDLEIYGPHALAERGFEVEAWDLSALLFPGAGPADPQPDSSPIRIRVIGSYAELHRRVSGEGQSALFVDHVAHVSGIDARNERLFRLLGKYRAKHVIIYAGGLPLPAESSSVALKCRVLGVKAVKLFSPRSLYAFLRRQAITAAFIHGSIYPRPLRIYSSSLGGATRRYVERYRIDPDTVVPIPSYDYDNYRKYAFSEGRRAQLPRSLCVYIDDDLTNHPDLKRYGIPLLSPGGFFAAMNRLFDRLECTLGGQVLVAGHPRSDYSEQGNPFSPRQIVRNKTMAMVIDARLVLAHYSTAVGFAVLARKPLLFVKTAGMLGTRHALLVDRFAEELEAPSVNVDDEKAVSTLDVRAVSVSATAYDRYVREYLKPNEAPDASIWDIIADDIGIICGDASGRASGQVVRERGENGAGGSKGLGGR